MGDKVNSQKGNNPNQYKKEGSKYKLSEKNE